MPDDLTGDEKEMLTSYRRARAMGFADIVVSFEEGLCKKMWITEKRNPSALKGMTRIKENG